MRRYLTHGMVWLEALAEGFETEPLKTEGRRRRLRRSLHARCDRTFCGRRRIQSPNARASGAGELS